jgi:exopolysaccharide production protein ExoQ
MSVLSLDPPAFPGIRWRTIETWGATTALFLHTGAIFPLLVMSADGGLDDAARATLRLVALPAYAITIVLLARHLGGVLETIRRNLPMAALLMLPVLSVAWSISPSISLRRAIGLLLSVMLSYLLATRFTPRQLLVLVGHLLGVIMVLSLLLYLAAPGLARMPLEPEMRGLFLHKNVLGWYAAFSALANGVLAFDREAGLRGRAGLFFVASMLCLGLSGSMTGMVSAASAAGFSAFYVLLSRMRGLRRVVLVLVFLQILALLLFLLQELLVPMLEALGKDATLTGRVPLWELVGPRIGDRLTLGYGFQAFWTPGNAEAWRIWAVIGWMAPHSHNGVRETLLSLGLFGLVFLVLVVGRGLVQGAALHNAQSREGWLWLNVVVSVFLVMNLTESLYFTQNDFLFILFCTALLSFSRSAHLLASRS